MGTGAKYSGIGLVVVTLGLAACGGKYAVGSGNDAGPASDAGAGSTGDDDSGGSSTSGGGTGGVAAGAASGGRGGTTDAGSFGGVAGTAAGGSATGGSAGLASCLANEGSFPEYERAAPQEVWHRLSQFIHGQGLDPLIPMPESTTDFWVREAVRALMDERTLADLAGRPFGLVTFLQGWAFTDEEAESAFFWGDNFARPGATFGSLFDSVHGRVSFLSDQGFLVAHPNSTRRGIWMMENLTCVAPVRPPPGIDIEPVTVPSNMTRRQVIESTVSDAVCVGCHAMWDPLGFSLENYDELGEYRTTENGLPIDTSGTYDQGFSSTFASIDDLAPDIAQSCIAAQCFASKVFEDALVRTRGVGNAEYDGSEHAYVRNRFTERNGEFLYLIEAIALTPSFLSP